MAERQYRITVEVLASDDLEEGTLGVLLGIVSSALTDADLTPVRLSIEEAL